MSKGSTHNLSNHRIYDIWYAMKRRCYDPRHGAFPRYGGRGIGIDEEWRTSITSFYRWAVGNGYEDTLTTDRIDNDKGYCPENCRWVTKASQSKNRRDNVNVFLFGEEKIVADWLRDPRIKVGKTTYLKRRRQGYTPEEALTKSKFISFPKTSVTIGTETQTTADWAEEFGVGVATVRRRVNKLKMTLEEALTTPVVKQRGK